MKYSKFIWAAVFLILFPSLIYSQDYRIDEGNYQKALNLMFSFRMKGALEELDSLQDRHAKDPALYFIEAVVYYYTSLIQKNNISDELLPHDSIAKKFNSNVDTSIALTKQYLISQKENPDLMLLLGACYGFQGLFLLNQGSMFSGYGKGKDGYDEIQKILSVNKNYLDAYLGIGLFNLFTSYVPWYIRWLIKSGDKEEGLKQITSAISGSKYNFTKYFALIYLDSFYYLEYRNNNSKNILDKRITVLKKFIKKYPDNFAMELDLASCYEIDDPDKAVETYNNVIELAEKEGNENLYNYAAYSLAGLYSERKENDKALSCYQNIITNSKKSVNYKEKSELKIAEIYMGNGEKQKAKHFLDELITTTSNKKIRERAIDLKKGL